MDKINHFFQLPLMFFNTINCPVIHFAHNGTGTQKHKPYQIVTSANAENRIAVIQSRVTSLRLFMTGIDPGISKEKYRHGVKLNIFIFNLPILEKWAMP